MFFKRWMQSHDRRRSKAQRASDGCNHVEELILKVKELEEEISLIKQNQNPKHDAPIIIENIHIEHFKVDKIEHENNFGALGIKELSGQLNIGANYHTAIPRNSREKKKESPSPAQRKNEGPRYTIRART